MRVFVVTSLGMYPVSMRWRMRVKRLELVVRYLLWLVGVYVY